MIQSYLNDQTILWYHPITNDMQIHCKLPFNFYSFDSYYLIIHLHSINILQPPVTTCLITTLRHYQAIYIIIIYYYNYLSLLSMWIKKLSICEQSFRKQESNNSNTKTAVINYACSCNFWSWNASLQLGN